MSDVDWVYSDRNILKRYAGQVVVVRDRRVWGAGETLDEALAAARAQPECPDPKRLRIVLVPLKDSHDDPRTFLEPQSDELDR